MYARPPALVVVVVVVVGVAIVVALRVAQVESSLSIGGKSHSVFGRFIGVMMMMMTMKCFITTTATREAAR